jgi:hypothetical protein
MKKAVAMSAVHDHERVLEDLFHALSQPLTTLGCCLHNAIQEPRTADLQAALLQVEVLNRLFNRIRELVGSSCPAPVNLAGHADPLGNLPCHSPSPPPVADNSGQ